MELDRRSAVYTREPGGVLDPPEGPAGLSRMCIEAIVRDERPKRSYDVQLRDIGEALRTSWQTPTDTMITDDLPTLLTLLSKVPKRRNRP